MQLSHDAPRSDISPAQPMGGVSPVWLPHEPGCTSRCELWVHMRAVRCGPSPVRVGAALARSISVEVATCQRLGKGLPNNGVKLTKHAQACRPSWDKFIEAGIAACAQRSTEIMMPEPVTSNGWRCPACGVLKPTDGYYRATSILGRMRVCKACHIARVVRRQAERYSNEVAYREATVRRVVNRQAKRYSGDSLFRQEKVKRVVRRQAKRYAEEKKYAVSQSMSVAIRTSLKNRKTGDHWEGILGYTVVDLMIHLEALFAPGMTWENYGEWHIDHITPRTAFDFSSPMDPGFRQCWSLGNLQPLWARDNIAKSDRLRDGSRARRRTIPGSSPKRVQ